MAFTYFFRDLQTLEMIRDYALPVLRTRKYIHIWDAGSAMGHEPYSLAIILRESMNYMYFRNVRIRATDIDHSNLFQEIIESGIYPWEQLERVPPDIFAKYFQPCGKPGYFQVVEEIRRAVVFQKHDLLSLQPVGDGYGLILCKNVLLHFHEAERTAVLKMFHRSLMEEGFLALEQTQKLPPAVAGLFQPVVSNAQLFQKKCEETGGKTHENP